MREALYLCRVIGTGRRPGTNSEFDEGDPFQPEIAADVIAGGEGHGCRIINLRTHEERRDRTGGWCLVRVFADDPVHAAIQAKFGLTELGAGTTKDYIDARIGAEATDEPFIDPWDYCRRVESRRASRDRQERERG